MNDKTLDFIRDITVMAKELYELSPEEFCFAIDVCSVAKESVLEKFRVEEDK